MTDAVSLGNNSLLNTVGAAIDEGVCVWLLVAISGVPINCALNDLSRICTLQIYSNIALGCP